MGEHTENFNEQMKASSPSIKINPDDVPFAVAAGFVEALSPRLLDTVLKSISLNGTRKSHISNKEIYVYCKEHGISGKGSSYQQMIDFNVPTIPDKPKYANLAPMDDVKIKGREGFVLDNNTEKKELTVQYNDDSEIDIINY